MDITLEWEDAELLVQANYTPGTPDVYYLSNGDPGYPGDPPELDIVAILVRPRGYAVALPTELGSWDEQTLTRLADEALQKAVDMQF